MFCQLGRLAGDFIVGDCAVRDGIFSQHLSTHVDCDGDWSDIRGYDLGNRGRRRTATVRDDVHFQPAEDAYAWTCDGIQWGISKTRHISYNPLVAHYGGDNYEYGFALATKGPVIWRWITPDHRNPKGKVTGARLAVTRTKGKTVYEGAVPWSQLTPLKPEAGKAAYFALILTDNDEQAGTPGSTKARGWFEGIFGGKDPKKFGKIVFIAR